MGSPENEGGVVGSHFYKQRQRQQREQGSLPASGRETPAHRKLQFGVEGSI